MPNFLQTPAHPSPGTILTVSQDDHEVAPLRGAERHGTAVVADHDESPDCQHQGVPDGHSVQDQGKVGVEQQEDCPAVGILNRVMIDLF